MTRKPRHLILPGDVIGHLTAVRFDHVDRNKRRHFIFRCSCGVEFDAACVQVTNGDTRSCGCARRDANIKRYNLAPGVAALRQVMTQYKRRDRKAHREWGLTEAQFTELIQMPCVYCGAGPNILHRSPHKTGDFLYTGLDRVDSALGYTRANVVPCCTACNRAKSDMTLREFKSWVRRVAQYMKYWNVK